MLLLFLKIIEMEKLKINVAIVGASGLVGKQIVRDIQNLEGFCLIVVTNSTKWLPVNTKLLNEKNWLAKLKTSPLSYTLNAVLDLLTQTKHSLLIDCTSSEELASSYPAILSRFFHLLPSEMSTL